ncbi:hypothetical protein HPB49_021824 [Dermacentor silvarum]|uniref:Uncharacterized protein n=1 Tax=Dermacentor silvarum TaxID=543639 RepID=A0ACB8DGP8_DERSI|nr:hypothetical protein HPB49_021824 [Dermacentor silvarum]
MAKDLVLFRFITLVGYVFNIRPISVLGQLENTVFNIAPINKRVLAEVQAIQTQIELITIFVVNRRRCRRRRRIWVRQVFAERSVHMDGDFHNLLGTLRNGGTALFYNFVRMSPQQFDILESLVRPLIEGQEKQLRESLSSAERWQYP